MTERAPRRMINIDDDDGHHHHKSNTDNSDDDTKNNNNTDEALCLSARDRINQTT